MEPCRMGGVVIEVATAATAVHGVDAVVLEDDTYLVLSAEPRFREVVEHPVRIWTEIHDFEPATPGTVVVREGRPLRLLAVVHDLSRDPTCDEIWVAQALTAVVGIARARGLRDIAMQALGDVHGRLGAERFVELLREALARDQAADLDRIRLIPGRGGAAQLQTLLDEIGGQSG